ncbi:KH domain-containing protein [Seleniivibrio woodruffii]|uniref:KH domain-containing protein n=1 Tax=Seleniivibrio woodruffii TaxID=1078050 RepID=UPI0026EF3C08|nr:KH domain-containing protein [Seleniivibrio woodruffii]
MKELVEFIVKSLVDKPEAVELKEVEGEKSAVLELRVDSADLGKVIGKQGRTAKAIRTIINASGVKNGKKVVLEILD